MIQTKQFQRLLLKNAVNNNVKLSASSLNKSTATTANGIEVNPNYVNRNPRNLEWSGQQYKRFGWNLQYPPKDFYHQCVFKKDGNSLTAFVEHHSGKRVVKASTDELVLNQYLYSTKDLSATIQLAALFVERCKRAGIDQLTLLKSSTFESSPREIEFRDTLVKLGLTLEEPEFVEKPDEMTGLDYDRKDFFQENRNLPFPPTENKIKREILENTLLERQSSK